MKQRGYPSLRVRHYGARAVVELDAPDLDRALDPDESEAIADAVRAAGYRDVEISREPLRSGSLTVRFLGRRT